MLTFYFSGAEGHMAVPEVLTAGMVGKQLRLEFSEEWEALIKTVVFSNGEITLDRIYTGETMVIPAQVLEKPLEKLTVGLYGVSQTGDLVIPTVRAKGPVILPGVDPTGDPGMDPSLPVWDQLLIMVEQLETLIGEEKEKLAAAINELALAMERNQTMAFYGTLSTALADINNGVTTNALEGPENAAVAVFTAHTGAKTVMLLADVSEAVQLDVTGDLDLVLNGKTLNLTAPAAYLNFTEGTHCRIFGNVTGSTISKTCDCSAYASSVRFIYARANLLEVHGGSYILRALTHKAITAFNINAAANEVLLDGCTIVSENLLTNAAGSNRGVQNDAKNLEIKNCSVTARNGGASAVASYVPIRIADSALHAVSAGENTRAVEIRETAVLHAKNTTMFADAPDCHAGYPHGTGLLALTTTIAHLDNCIVTGTHSGVQCSGKLYINGGVYTGFCHGGAYISGAGTGLAYINDATLRCGNYEGEFDYSGKTAEIYGSMYIGGDADSCNLSAYLDGCSIEHNGGHPIVLRGTDGEQNNTVYISNSNITGGQIRIDNDTLKLMVGAGTNITTNNIDNPTRSEFTEGLYRKNHADKTLNGHDFDALADRLRTAGGVVNTVGGIAPDKTGNVPLDWVATKTFRSLVILEESAIAPGFTSAVTYDELYGQEEVAVLFDERLYLCVPQFGYSEGDGYFVHLGNKSLLSSGQPDTGEPFLMHGYQGTSLIAVFRESGSHTMSITGYVYDYNKLPAGYLPMDAIRELVTAVLEEKGIA